MTPTPDIGKLIGAVARRAGLPLPAPMQRLEIDGKTALITGAGQGIGLALARELHALGANVALLDVDLDALTRACDELGHERTIPLVTDVRDREAMRHAVEETIARFGALDIVVANAGVAPQLATLRTLDPDEYDRVIAINQTGVFNTVKPAIEPIIESRGHIVVVASVAALLPGPGGAPYMISKAAVEQLGRTLRIELAPHNATAGVAYFGIVETEMTRTTIDRDPLGEQGERYLPPPLRTRITPQQAARVIADGIVRRAGRTIAPAAWQPVAALRGIIGQLDDLIAGDPRAQALLNDIEARSARTTAPTG
jgi:NAD(P)-dependent dehydrogenase (short-subunit alcohol dehydrogenase family)